MSRDVWFRPQSLTKEWVSVSYRFPCHCSNHVSKKSFGMDCIDSIRGCDNTSCSSSSKGSRSMPSPPAATWESSCQRDSLVDNQTANWAKSGCCPGRQSCRLLLGMVTIPCYAWYAPTPLVSGLAKNTPNSSNIHHSQRLFHTSASLGPEKNRWWCTHGSLPKPRYLLANHGKQCAFQKQYWLKYAQQSLYPFRKENSF